MSPEMSVITTKRNEIRRVPWRDRCTFCGRGRWGLARPIIDLERIADGVTTPFCQECCSFALNLVNGPYRKRRRYLERTQDQGD